MNESETILLLISCGICRILDVFFYAKDLLKVIQCVY